MANQHHTGTTVFYDPGKRWGFLRPDGAKAEDMEDVFFHLSAMNGESPPHNNDRVQFEVVVDRNHPGRLRALHVKVLETAR